MLINSWFRETYGVTGSVECAVILSGGQANPVCPALIETTYLFACELLKEYGYPFPD